MAETSFDAVGGSLNSNFRLRLLWSGSAGQDQTITLNESISNFKTILVVARASDYLTYETHTIPTDAIEYIPSATTTSENAWVVGVKYATSTYATTLIGFLSETQVYVMDRNKTAGWTGFTIVRIYGMK